MKLLIHQRTRVDGSLEDLFLSREDDALRVQIGADDEAFVPIEALVAVMRKFGKPLAPEIRLGATALELGDGRSLTMLRHLARYDVIARDFLVFCAPNEEPLAELASSVTAALMHLVEAYRSMSSVAH
ncbi:MAG: hypothetical protein ABIP89_13790 [Polyangiaceae bacterium]